MLIYHIEVPLDEGFEVLTKERKERLVKGKNVSRPGGWLLFEALRAAGSPLTCWSCGAHADRWVSNKGRKDFVGGPTLDLFGSKDGHAVLFTRDHIIPRSYGGVDAIENLRIGCAPCNHDRGNGIEAVDIEFIRAHPELIDPDRMKFTVPDEATSIEKVITKSESAMTPEERRKAKRRKERERRKRRKARIAAERRTEYSIRC